MLSIFSTAQKYLIVILLSTVLALSVTVGIQHWSNTDLRDQTVAQAQSITQLKSDIALSNAQVEALKKASDDITLAATKLVEKARQDSKVYINKSDEILNTPQNGDACKAADALINSVLTK